ncbi:MAG: Nucleotidyl transferase [Alphaproteobacteria bacterium]|jgi:MurNAc alpha-1-phosphate uridylyltransferase|nr:Nucleotidyl transferase [Alphaproteobacteria bacterium]
MSGTPLPKRAMVLAAGLGQRMRPLSDSKPKALIEVAGRSLLDRALDRLQEAGVGECVVNVHHLAPLMERHLAERRAPVIKLSHESVLLETGGGVKQALPLLGEEPFFVANCDALWLDGPRPMLKRLARAFDPARMDALLLLHPMVSAHGFDGAGDYFMTADGALRRRRKETIAPFVYAGAQILTPALFKTAPEGPFSLRLLYDQAEENGRLFGMRHDGEWYHVGTPEAVSATEALLTGRPRQSISP